MDSIVYESHPSWLDAKSDAGVRYIRSSEGHGVCGVIQAQWRRLAEERVGDAKILLNGGQRAGAYYLAGYAVECGLKSCELAFVEKNPDIVFRDRKYSDKCWTHDIESLVTLAGLEADRDADTRANPDLRVNWGLVQIWSEKSRYELNTELEAKRHYEAVTHNINGVLPWIQDRW